MVSIRLPGMVGEKKLVLPDWQPDVSEGEVLEIKDVKRLEELYNGISHKIEKLQESTAALREYQKEIGGLGGGGS